jgi:hypothetical protein
MAELTAQQLSAKTRVSKAVLKEAQKVGAVHPDVDVDDLEGDVLFEAADTEIDGVMRAFMKGFRNEAIHAVLTAAQRASEAEGQTLEGWTVEVETDRGQSKDMVFTRDHLFQLETHSGPAPEPEEETHTNGYNGDEQKTIEDVITGYARLHAREIVEKMKTLSDEEIELVKAHELEGEERPNILNFVHNPADEETWEGDPEESKEYEQEQEAPADDNFVLDRDLTKEELREDVDEIFKKYFKEADYDKRRNTSIEKKIGEFTPDEIRTLLDYESLPYEKGGPRHRDNVIKFLKQTLAEIAKTQPELVDEEQVAEVPAPEPDPEEPKFNPATQQMETEPQQQETEQVAEIPTESDESYQEQKVRLRKERISGDELVLTDEEREFASGSQTEATWTNVTRSGEVQHYVLPTIAPRQQGAIEQEELNQRVLSSLAHLGLPEPEIPSEVPKLPSEVDNGILTEDMIHQQMMLFAANQGYATYHAEQYEAEEVAKKAMADKAAYELRRTIGVMTEDGKHKKLESQIDAEVETHSTVAAYREEQKFAASAAKRLRGSAAFYGACERALSRILTTRQEQLKRR